MSDTIFSRLYHQLAALIPSLSFTQAGATLHTQPYGAGDMEVCCCIEKVGRNALLIELSDNRYVDGALVPVLEYRVRVDITNALAEVLEVQDVFGYQVVYQGDELVNAARNQINLAALNWLQLLLNCSLTFEPTNAELAAAA